MNVRDNMVNIRRIAFLLLMCDGSNFNERLKDRSNVANKIDELLLISNEGVDYLLVC